jgi:hypothetical protein
MSDQEREALKMYAGRIEEDRREPDKILCHAQSMRSAALAAREDTERPDDDKRTPAEWSEVRRLERALMRRKP